MTKTNLPLIFTVVGVLSLAIAGCALFPKNGAPLSGAERPFFTTVTNYHDIVTLKTNLVYEPVPVPVYVTNAVSGDVVTQTNIIQVPQYVIIPITNQFPEYTHKPNETAQGAASVGGTIANLFVPGSGGVVTTAILGAFSLWAGWRSKKNKDTGIALTQEIETILEFVYSLPKGAAYHEAVTRWLQEHQIATGTAQEILKILEKTTDNRDAVSAMEGIRGSISALGTTMPPRDTPPPGQ